MPKFTVDFSKTAWAIVQVLASEEGKSPAEVISDAIALKKFVHDQRRAGNAIMLEKNGSVREIVSPDRR